LIVPSEWPENAPLSVLEALSLGVPVLGSDQGGLPEIVDTANQRSFKTGNVTDLAEALVTMWADRKGLEVLRENARKAYESDFCPEIHMLRYFSVINKASS
jgi:glycosyltransferase involved in cell wall biosynthesis